jgi:quinol monooxygenase YgiN
MATPTDERRDLVTVVATMRAQPGREDELRAALEEMVGPSTGDAGCVTYDLHQGLDDPAVFVFYENWESAEELQAHLRQPHVARFSAAAAGLLDGDITILRVRRIA